MPEHLRAAIVFALLLASPLGPARAEPLNPMPAFIAELQSAIRDDDNDWLADHLHLPVNYFRQDEAGDQQQGLVPQTLRNRHRS
jgi:hypothetical protein